MKRKTTLFLLGLMLITVFLCISAQAEPIASGTFGRPELAMQWSVEGNTLYITGNGYMDGFSNNDSRPWDVYRDQIQRIVMSGTMDNVGNYAFVGCSKLKEIVWPDGLKYINDYAFSGCTSLQEVTIPDQVEVIFEYAFKDCVELRTVSIPKSVIRLEQGVFYECAALHTVTLSSGLKEIGRYCFRECKDLKQIELPNTLLKIGSAAFRESGLQKIVIPEQVHQVDGGVFTDCSNLKEVTFSCRSLETFGNHVFLNCKALTTLRFLADVTTVQMDSFGGCDNLKEVCFFGDMPKFVPSYVDYVSITFCYPEGNTTWTQGKLDAYIEGHLGEVKLCAMEELPAEKPTEATIPATSPTVVPPTEQTQPENEAAADNVTTVPSTGAVDQENNIQSEPKEEHNGLLLLVIVLSAVLVALITAGCIFAIKLRRGKV